VVGVMDPRHAIERCRAFAPDLLLLDLHMPGIDGVELLLQLQAESAADTFLPKIVLTADVTEEAKLRALAAGANDFLTKPLDRIEVLLRVETC
jgi:putative two-component system response regulator